MTCSVPPQQGQALSSTSITLDPRQMRRQRAAIAFRRLGTRRTLFGFAGAGSRRRRIQPRWLFGHGLFEILAPALHCFVVELFGTAAKSVALQTGDDQPQPLDLGQRRAQDLL